jgi:hypothetical protein
MSALAATGGLHIGRGLPRGGVISQTKAAAWSPADDGRPPPADAAADVPAAALSAGTAAIKPRRDNFFKVNPSVFFAGQRFYCSGADNIEEVRWFVRADVGDMVRSS